LKLAYYFDDNIATRPVVAGLVARDISAITADQAGNRGKADAEHLEFAARIGLVLVTADRGDFTALHWDWVAAGRDHAGIVLVRQRTSIGRQIDALVRLHTVQTAEDARGRLLFLADWLRE
jgi:hypothetical protein